MKVIAVHAGYSEWINDRRYCLRLYDVVGLP